MAVLTINDQGLEEFFFTDQQTIDWIRALIDDKTMMEQNQFKEILQYLPLETILE